MEEAKGVCKCPICAAREQEKQESEHMNLAVLVALVPMLVITLFSQIGLF